MSIMMKKWSWQRRKLGLLEEYWKERHLIRKLIHMRFVYFIHFIAYLPKFVISKSLLFRTMLIGLCGKTKGIRSRMHQSLKGVSFLQSGNIRRCCIIFWCDFVILYGWLLVVAWQLTFGNISTASYHDPCQW